MKVVIIDDEPGALDALRGMIERRANGARVVGEALNALEGIKVIQKVKPDLVLLDIEMPHGSGFELLEAFPERTFQVIFTTAHEEHAVRAAHTHPFDYLLKPVDPDDLNRALDQLSSIRLNGPAKRIEISSQQGRVYLDVDEIVRVEADGGYSTLHTTGGEKHVASKSIGYFEELLPKDRFFRCHHSHLICMPMVKGLDNRDGGIITMRDGSQVPLASRRHGEFGERVG
jgi:two-component system LytT family response regulator